MLKSRPSIPSGSTSVDSTNHRTADRKTQTCRNCICMSNNTVRVQIHQIHVMTHDGEDHELTYVSPKVKSETYKII